MEVASPLTFAHVKAGSKRRFACSPLDSPGVVGIETNVDDYAMDDCTTFGHSFKKRRCDDMDIQHHSPTPHQPFGSLHSSLSLGKFFSHDLMKTCKRTRGHPIDLVVTFNIPYFLTSIFMILSFSLLK